MTYLAGKILGTECNPVKSVGNSLIILDQSESTVHLGRVLDSLLTNSLRIESL